VDTLTKHLPVNGSEGLLELQKIAQRFEDKIFTAATSEVHTFTLRIMVIYAFM
jgi:PAX-interacting protein 1